MEKIRFDSLERYLKTGREIEFSYKGKRYSITTNKFWFLCLDEDDGSTVLDKICPYQELDCLADKIAETRLEGISIRQIFDELLYDESSLYIL